MRVTGEAQNDATGLRERAGEVWLIVYKVGGSCVGLARAWNVDLSYGVGLRSFLRTDSQGP